MLEIKVLMKSFADNIGNADALSQIGVESIIMERILALVD